MSKTMYTSHTLKYNRNENKVKCIFFISKLAQLIAKKSLIKMEINVLTVCHNY